MRIDSSNRIQNQNFGRLIVDRRLTESIEKSPELDTFVKNAKKAIEDYEWGDILMALLPGAVAGIGYYTSLRQPLREGDMVKKKYIDHVRLDPTSGLIYNMTEQDFHNPTTSTIYRDIYYYMKNQPFEKQDSYEKAFEIAEENERIANITNTKLEEDIAYEKEFQNEMSIVRDEYSVGEY